MPFDITILESFSESELLAMRATLVNSISGGTVGTVLTSVTTRDLSTTFAVGSPPEQMLKAVSYALWKIDPIAYKQPESTKVKRYYTL